MYASPVCLLAFARDSKRPCLVLYVPGGFRIKLSVSFVFKLERLSSVFGFAFSKLLNINYFHTCKVLFLKGRKLRSRECAFRVNNIHSVSGINSIRFCYTLCNVITKCFQYDDHFRPTGDPDRAHCPDYLNGLCIIILCDVVA